MTDLSVLAMMALPPPMTGQAAAAAMLKRALVRHGVEHAIVDFSRELAPASRVGHLANRLLTCGALPLQALWSARTLSRVGVFYLQLGQGPRSLARDLPVLELAQLRGWPVVLHLHGGGLPRALADSPRLLRDRVVAAVRRASATIALSPILAAGIEASTGARNIRIVENGVGQRVEEAARRTVKTAPADRPLRVLFLSNLMESKGYRLVLECAKVAKRRGLPLEFVLAGAPTDMMTVDPAAFIAREGLRNARYVGPVDEDEKIRLLTEADAFLLPSRYATEGQPIAILEALHFGVPVITTRAGGIGDIVEEGKTGFFVSAAHVEETLSRLAFLQADPAAWTRVSATCRDAAAAYTEERHGDRMVELLREAAGTGRGRAVDRTA